MKKIFSKKRIIWGIIIIVIVGLGWLFMRSKKDSAVAAIQTDTARKQDLVETVLTTGQVTSDLNLELSFQGGGVVQGISVKEGEVVKAGQILATLDQATVSASLVSAQGALAQAQANLERVTAGATSEQITVAQRTVDANAQALADAQNNLASVTKLQDTSVKNAYRTLLNGSLGAIQVVGPYTSAGVTATSAPTVSGFYSGSEQGTYTITQSGNTFSVSGLETIAPTSIDTRSTLPLGTHGLYVQFQTNQISATWEISIPNDKSATYVLNYNAYQSALAAQTSALTTAQSQVESSRSQLNSAEASLAQSKATATPADVNVAKAQILSAEGQVAAAQASFNNTVLKAPSSGTITKVDIKVGEQATPSKEVMVLQDVGHLYAEANVSEANIASLRLGQSVDYTFDALGPDRHFKGKISTINPASTVVSGVVNYKVTADFENVSEIKPGMTANMTILVSQKPGVLAVPNSAVINQSDKQYVRVVDDPIKKTYHQVEVQTGLQADGGLIEITNGLTDGQQIVTFVK